MRIHHLALRTDDLPRLEGFYAGLVGLEIVRRDDDHSVWLDAGGTILMLEQRSTDEPAIKAASMELTCFAIDPGEHHAVARQLEAAGYAIEARTAYSMYVRDPDGRRVGFSSYPSELARSPGSVEHA